MAPAETLLVVDDPLFDQHRARGSHPERPERLRAAREALGQVPAAKQLNLSPRDATTEELCRIHHPRYVDELVGVSGKSGYLDADTYVVERSVEAARRAAGGCIALAEALARGTTSLGVALVRPPGHHARPDGAMGFCLLNNVALAAAAVRAAGIERVAIVDWDVHHGNGTQDAFYDDPSVLYVSMHQSPFYPGTGAAEEVGAGEGRGTTVNVPLSAGAGPATYVAALERIVAPVVEQFDPGVLLFSAGFDAHLRDPLAEMRLDGPTYAAMTLRLAATMPSERRRLGVVLEGGYDLVGLREGLGETLGALTRATAGGPCSVPPDPTDEVGQAHEDDLRRAAAAQTDFWRLY